MPRQERERRYIAQYMKDTAAEGPFQLNVELGAIPEEYVTRYGQARAAALFRPTRPRVDAVRWLPDSYILIEAKLRDIKAGIGDLLYYRSLIPETLDLPYYAGQPIITRLVVPFEYEWIKRSATASGIELVVQWYDWVSDYVKERQHYFTAEYRDARKELMKLRETLGVE
ncbi:MAG: hypothetical protein HWN68_10975 [Desulfobacterales bacterium]|nr:hypothetical protein [Desulfobacterales bacterium]